MSDSTPTPNGPKKTPKPARTDSTQKPKPGGGLLHGMSALASAQYKAFQKRYADVRKSK